MKFPQKDFFSQAVHTLTSKAVLMAVGILTGIITARVLKPEGRGLLEMYLVFPQLIVSFGELGIRQAAAHYTGQDRFPVQDIISSLVALFFLVALVGFGIVIAFYWQSNLFSTSLILPIIFAFWVPSALLQRFANGVFLGKQEVQKVNYSHIIQSFSLLIGLVIFVWLVPLGVGGAGVAHLLSQLLPAIVLVLWLNSYGKLRPKWISPVPQMLLKKGIIYAGTLFLMMLNYRIDVVMLGNMSTKGSVGIYSIGVSVCEVLKQIPLSVGVVLFAHATSWKEVDLDVSLEKLARLTRILFFLSVIGALIFIVIVPSILPVIFGKEYSESVLVVYCLLPGIVALNIFSALNLFVAAQGKPQLLFYAFLPALILNILLNAIWIPKYDYLGSAISSSVSYAVGCALFFMIFSFKYHAKINEYLIPKFMDIKFIIDKIRLVSIKT